MRRHSVMLRRLRTLTNVRKMMLICQKQMLKRLTITAVFNCSSMYVAILLTLNSSHISYTD